MERQNRKPVRPVPEGKVLLADAAGMLGLSVTGLQKEIREGYTRAHVEQIGEGRHRYLFDAEQIAERRARIGKKGRRTMHADKGVEGRVSQSEAARILGLTRARVGMFKDEQELAGYLDWKGSSFSRTAVEAYRDKRLNTQITNKDVTNP